MNIIQIIEKKRDKKPLTEDEISWFIAALCSDKIPDYQVSALLMAICINGMNDDETAVLTRCMAQSGDMIDMSFIDGVTVDKHSSGGVGDKISLICAPMAAACGLPVAKMSGRGLGFSGGTIDKLESIPGFRTSLSQEEFRRFVSRDGIALMSQTKNVAPADKRLYALRDVTGTVPSIPLIASSIMSKKLACGCDAIVLDVKYGSGAFMKTAEQAVELAVLMESIGRKNGREVTALITNMEQPLGNAVGNALEVKEAIQTLKGEGPADVTELSYIISSFMLTAGKKAPDLPTARKMLENAVKSGAALEKLRCLISNQGGDTSIIDHPEQLKAAPVIKTVLSSESGVITGINGEITGNACLTLKAGRLSKADEIDHSTGFVFLAKAGSKVEKGQPIAQIHSGSEKAALSAEKQLLSAYTFGQKYNPKPLLAAYIDKEGIHYDKNSN